VDAWTKKLNLDIAASDTEGAVSEAENEEWEGFGEPAVAPAVQPVDHEDEYLDDDKYTTVTVEAVDIGKEGFRNLGQDGDNIQKHAADDGKDNGDDGKKRTWTKERPTTDRPKKKKQKFRYENKTERKVTRVLERSKNKKQAKARKG